MKKILITEHRDEGFIVLNDQLTRISTNNEEVLSGVPPTPGNKYMDLTLTGTGGTGTSGNPWTADQFCSAISGSSGVTFNILGIGSTTSISSITATGAVLQSWDGNPWRLRAVRNGGWVIIGITATQGVIDYINTGNGDLVFPSSDILNNCCLMGNVGIDIRSSQVNGCVINITGSIRFTTSTVKDSTFVGSTLTAGASTTFDNCATNKANYNSGTANNCQVNWSAPAMPAWNAAASSWAYNTIMAGITTPPQPGNPPYTGYSTMLFGDARIGIGNGYVSPVVAPVANFTAAPTSGIFPLTVDFTDTSTGGAPSTWAWVFGDGSPTVTDQSPQYTYDIDAGTFTVSLTVTNAGGSDTKTRTNYITVTAIAPTITTQPASQIVALSSNVTFSVVAVATPPLTDLTYQWQKGDVNIAGATSSSLTLSHVLFTDQANYRVVVTDAAGYVNSNEATLTVIDTKKAGASNNPDDRVGMPKANAETSGTPIRDLDLTTEYGGNTLELGKINHIGLILRDTQDGSSDGARARNNENTNGVKGLLPRMAELVQTITTFFYKVR